MHIDAEAQIAILRVLSEQIRQQAQEAGAGPAADANQALWQFVHVGTLSISDVHVNNPKMSQNVNVQQIEAAQKVADDLDAIVHELERPGRRQDRRIGTILERLTAASTLFGSVANTILRLEGRA